MERIGAPGHRELQILEIRSRYSQPWLPGILNCLRRGNTLNLTTFRLRGSRPKFKPPAPAGRRIPESRSLR